MNDYAIGEKLLELRMSTTYVMGKDALLHNNLVFDEISKPRWHWYRSNWRVLHIDGFETGFGFRLVRYQFAQHALPPRENKTSDSIV